MNFFIGDNMEITYIKTTNIPDEKLENLLTDMFENSYISDFVLKVVVEKAKTHSWLPAVVPNRERKLPLLPTKKDYVIYFHESHGECELKENEYTEKRLNYESLEKALGLLCFLYPRHFRDIENDNEDADTLNALMQVFCFGEIIMS